MQQLLIHASLLQWQVQMSGEPFGPKASVSYGLCTIMTAPFPQTASVKMNSVIFVWTFVCLTVTCQNAPYYNIVLPPSLSSGFCQSAITPLCNYAPVLTVYTACLKNIRRRMSSQDKNSHQGTASTSNRCFLMSGHGARKILCSSAYCLKHFWIFCLTNYWRLQLRTKRCNYR